MISINGASACILAAILSFSKPNGKVLLPRDCHRSAVHALILSGLDPVWYEGLWNEEWNVWSGIDEESFVSLLERHRDELTAAFAVSVNYSGVHTNIETIARECRSNGIPLIVDEAHGAHLVETSALRRGADIVIHSLHKTLGALTQTGLMHLHSHFASADNCDKLRSALNLVHTSSPSYILMSSVEGIISDFEKTKSEIKRVQILCEELRPWLEDYGATVFGEGTTTTDPLHILFRLPGLSASELQDALQSKGIFAETILGNGLLLLLGQGTTPDDINKLKEAIKTIDLRTGKTIPSALKKPKFEDQVLSPRQAWSMKSEQVEIDRAAGRIASDCIAPCPPGTPVLCPGQRIPSAIPIMLPEHRWLRVVKES